ncbi:uncharacterized protein LOC134647470 [Cydia amplana]|uniref:uncharacterized protein LOC134647470 n=1 Tax=Cydia amplana TaxID=1869771 RepID=UPI002FE59F06
MQVKAAELSQQVAKTVENHLNTTYQLPVPTTTSTKTPNELAVPDDKLSKSDDSGYADNRQETDIDEKNNKTNLELMKRIEEIQAQLDALQFAKAEKDNAEKESSPYSKSIDYYYKSDDEQKIKDQNISPKPTRISIFEREALKLPKESERTNEVIFDNERKTDTIHNNQKLNTIIETDTPTKENQCTYKEIYVRNDSNSDKSNETQVNNPPEQVVGNCSVKCECPDDNADQVGKKNCSVICECPDDLETNTWTESSETKSPEKGLSPMVKVTVEQIPGPIPNNETSAKRRFSLTRKKPKPVAKRKIEPAKDQSKKVNKKDKKSMSKHEKDENDTRQIEPSESIEYNGTGELKSQEYEDQKLPLDVTPKTNDIRRIYGYAFVR